MSRKRDIISAKPVFVDEKREAHRRATCAVSNLERAIVNLVLSLEERSIFERVLESNRAIERKLINDLKADGNRPSTTIAQAKKTDRRKNPKPSRKPTLSPEDYRALSRDIQERNRAGLAEDASNNLRSPTLDVVQENG